MCHTFNHAIEVSFDAYSDSLLWVQVEEAVESEMTQAGWHNGHCPQHAPEARQQEHLEKQFQQRREE